MNPREQGSAARRDRAVALAASAFLLACVALYLWRSRHWPLVNDAALMHYVVFLMNRGLAPYRDIGDINLPGAYAPEWVSMRLAALFHLPEAAMWRIMDAGALLLAGLAMAAIAGRERWFAAVWAGSLFALYHGRDGIGQAGQRDLWMTVLLLWAVAAIRKPGRPRSAVLAGLAIGAATTIKPFAAAWLLCLLWLPRSSRRAAFAAFLIPFAAAALFLQHWQARGDFWRVLTVDLPYYARLADGSIPQLLAKSSPPSILLLLALGLACLLATARMHVGLRALGAGSESLLLLGVLLGLISFVAQGKGYPYQRYPFIAFGLLLAALAFQSALGSPREAARAFGIAGFAFGVLFCAPAYLRAALRAHWPTDAQAAMENAIRAQNVGDGEIQCIDAVSGCTDALLALHLRQATGTLYDEYLFPQAPAPWGTVYTGFPPGAPLPRAVALARERFKPAFAAHPPRVLIVTSWLFPEGPGDYRKLALWPWFRQYLQEHYTLQSEYSFARAENGPLGFRVYTRQ